MRRLTENTCIGSGVAHEHELRCRIDAKLPVGRDLRSYLGIFFISDDVATHRRQMAVWTGAYLDEGSVGTRGSSVWW